MPSSMEIKYDSVTLSEALWWAKRSKRVPYPEAKDMQFLLLSRAVEVGVSSPDVMDVINGMLDHFVEEERKMKRELMAEELRRKGILQQEKIDADDDQIVKAIKWTLPKFKSDWDWAGIYRILVDNCDFPPGKADFVRRMARMGVYPNDDYPKDLVRSMPPAIRGKEWYGHQFSYQAIQKGIKTSWPDAYYGWQNSDIQDRDFLDRRCVAKIFKANLLKAVKEP